jgi:RNA-directed DNA polymerase
MERVCECENLNRAHKRVRANKGAPGVDGMAVGELYDWLREHTETLVESLLDGSYEPQPVLSYHIPQVHATDDRSSFEVWYYAYQEIAGN